jgi:hypothetical protein
LAFKPGQRNPILEQNKLPQPNSESSCAIFIIRWRKGKQPGIVDRVHSKRIFCAENYLSSAHHQSLNHDHSRGLLLVPKSLVRFSPSLKYLFVRASCKITLDSPLKKSRLQQTFPQGLNRLRKNSDFAAKLVKIVPPWLKPSLF